MALPAGVRLGSYEILGAIGAGGMGEVYRARDSKLGRDVAIKVLPEAFTRDAGRVLRFEREAKLLAALNHPNIAAIYGIEDSNGSLALVMEYVDGPTLADRIRSGPIPIEEVLPIARQIADALEYAHEHGIVHRDLKPSNVKVTSDDAVKVLDFGLAKAVQGEASDADIHNSPTITHMATEAGVLLGTAAYMSPEQAKGKPVDRRADIWAFGCVLYEMLTGKMAFRGDTVTETLAAILSSEPDWSLLPAATPIRVRVLLQRCLQKDAKQRLRDIGDARISLDEVLTGAPDPALSAMLPGAATRWRRLLPWTAATLLSVALAWLAFVHFREKPPAPAESVRFQVALPEKSIFLLWITLSPDGRHLAIVTLNQDGRVQLWIRDIDSLESRLIPNVENANNPFWSPDSHSLAFQRENRLERVDISGGAPQTICTLDRLMFGGAWNRDDVILFGSLNGLMKVSAAGGQPSILIKNPHSIGYFIGYPAFLPDGRHFFYVAPRESGLVTFVGSLDTKEKEQSTKPLVTEALSGLLPTSSSGFESILFIKPDGTLVTQPFDTSRMELKGDPSPVADSVVWFTLSANGVLAYAGGNATPLRLTWFDRQGKVLGTLGEPGIYPTPAISPDGRIVAVPLFDKSGKSDIWLYDLTRGGQTRFTLNGQGSRFPVWSPDNSRLAFFSPRPGISSVYQKPLNGVGQEEPFNMGSDKITIPLDWSRDGRYLIEWVIGDKDSIWAQPLSPGKTGAEQKLIPLNEGSNANYARLSPDGKWIAYNSDETGRDEIFVRTFPNPGGKWQVSANGGSHPVWSRDGKELYYIAPDGNLMAADVKNQPDGSFDWGAAKVLFNPLAGTFNRPWWFDVTKDGRFLIPSLARQQSLPPINVIVNWRPGLK
jgi:serine/threonine protein kinase